MSGLSAFGGMVFVTSSRMDQRVQVDGLAAFDQVDAQLTPESGR